MPTLDAEVARRKLSKRDAALATAIVYGTLRALNRVDAALDEHLDRPKKLDAWARAALRGGAFQILYMDRVPVRAVVHETVGVVKAKRGRLGGLANAVLRKLKRPDPIVAPQLDMPAWVVDAFALSEERTVAIRTASEPSIDLRASGDRDALIAVLKEKLTDAEVTVGTFEQTVHVRGGGDPRRWPGYTRGEFSVQEQGAQIIGALVDAQPGQRVLDACAGRGGKTLQLAGAMKGEGSITAVDLHEARVEQIESGMQRLGLKTPVSMETIDWTVGDGGLEPGFDRILVDAPCSGLGTLHRRPEILLRLKPEVLGEMATLQATILERVAPLLRPGGTLLYAVCSLAKKECDPETLSRFGTLEPLEGADPDGILRLGPWRDCDGYQIARVSRAGGI